MRPHVCVVRRELVTHTSLLEDCTMYAMVMIVQTPTTRKTRIQLRMRTHGGRRLCANRKR